MDKQKRLPVPKNVNYTGLGRDDKDSQEWLIQKVKPLTTLSQTSMTLSEFKIFDAYLSRIDSHKPEERYVQFEKGELEKLLGVKKINKADLTKRLRNLFQTLEIYDERKPRGFTLIALFAKAECEQDEDGLWKVNLACTAEAMEYIFNIENIGYLRYRLRNVINLTSRYSYILFLYLLDNRWRKTWSIALNDLKQLLNCTADTYNEYKRFNDLVLKKCYKEVNTKTDCHFEYEPLKRGRRVVEIRFIYYHSEEPQKAIPKDTTSEQWQDKELWEEVVKDFSFSKEQIEEIRQVLVTVPDYKLPQDVTTYHNDIDFRRYHYMAQKVARLERYETTSKIKNKYAYLLKMIKSDAKEI